MRRRGCLLGCGSTFGLLVICLIVAYFVALPRFRDSVGDSISDVVSTQVVEQIPVTDIGPGTYTISLADMESALGSSDSAANAQDIQIRTQGDQLLISFVSGDQEFGYSGRPTVEDGKLVMADMEVTNGALGWFLSADRLGDSVETGINTYFEQNNLLLTSVTVGEQDITVEAVAAN